MAKVARELGYTVQATMRVVKEAQRRPKCFLQWGLVANTTVGIKGYDRL